MNNKFHKNKKLKFNKLIVVNFGFLNNKKIM